MELIAQISKFMGLLADHATGLRHEVKQVRQEIREMSETLQSIRDKLAQQGAQIDQLAAEKSATEQATLDAIGASIDENTAKLTTALQPAVQ